MLHIRTEQMILITATIIIASLSTIQTFAEQSIELKGAYIYQESGEFKQETLYIIDGLITYSKPAIIDTSINIEAAYIIPPFGDAHTHNLDRSFQIPGVADRYMSEGTHYVQNLTSKADEANKYRSYFESDSTVDVLYSMAGLTSTLGHPFGAYEPFLTGIPYPEWRDRNDEIINSRIDENNSYIFIDSVHQVSSKLSIYYNQKPDIAKIFILHSNKHNTNIANDKMGDTGLSREVTFEVVKDLKKNGLKVYAHIENTIDFRLAVDAGVDALAHMPGYGYVIGDHAIEDYYIDDDLMKYAISEDLKIIPTLQWGLRLITQESEADSLVKIDYIKDIITRYKDHGGQFIIGSDVFFTTLAPEINAFYDIGAFSHHEILEIVSVITPQFMFPDRKIGALSEGYEANLLVLNKNPLLHRLTDSEILLNIKAGSIIK